MKKFKALLLATALALPIVAFAQDNQSMQQDNKLQKAQQDQAASIDVTGQTNFPRHNMTGVVSNNGKSFTSDNTTYIVSNPKALKSYEDQTVMVKFLFDADSNSIRILSASPAQ